MKYIARTVGALALAAIVSALPGRARTDSADTLHTDVALSTQEVRSHQTAFGSLVADAVRDAGHADVAFVAAASFSDGTTAIKPGPFTVADALKMLEFPNETVAVVKLSGTQMRQALAYGLYLYPTPSSSFLQTSGLTVTIAPDSEGDQRVVAVKVGEAALTPTQTYHVAMPATLANGALAYFKYWKKTDIEKDTGVTLQRAVTDYLNTHRTIVKGDERLVVKSR